ncbi:MAG: hypothetical protein H7641_13475, partial [Candidatus Heimdallarchaeota archaeon]|nr:hypothetical protein [Candidatus Heimdallarchaeota archaeon]MCK4878571.1 hypothetical protein [Candidatus Heimdallarchaeota archaeon]
MNILIVDALAANEGRRKFSRDAIGVGPRLLAGICDKQAIYSRITRVEDLLEQENVSSLETSEIFFISAMTVDEIAVKRIVRKIREESNSAFIVIGGPITTNPKILQKLEINLAVYGEGEFIVDELICNDFSIESLSKIDNEIQQINGKYYIKRKNIHKINPFDIF